MTDAYIVGVKLRSTLESDQSLWTALRQLAGPFDLLDDGYPEWHPAPHSFEGLLRLFLYRELTGESYCALTRYPELADAVGLEKIADESVLSRTWHRRFDDATREFVTTAAHYVVKGIHDRDIDVPEARPKAEVVSSDRDPSAFPDDSDEDDSLEFTPEQIHRTTRLARDHGFDGFDSGRAANATYEDTAVLRIADVQGDGLLWHAPRRYPVSVSPQIGGQSSWRHPPQSSQTIRARGPDRGFRCGDRSPALGHRV